MDVVDLVRPLVVMIVQGLVLTHVHLVNGTVRAVVEILVVEAVVNPVSILVVVGVYARHMHN